MKKKWKLIVIAVIAVLVLIQLIPVQRTNPPVTADIQAPAEVKAILKTSCYDCHSHETHWPFYSYVAPVSWFIARDVQRGRASLNFSEWGTHPEEVHEFLKQRIYEEVSHGEMPLRQYVLMHPSARISDAELNTLKQWAGPAPDIEQQHEP
jgi:hypothetical protein